MDARTYTYRSRVGWPSGPWDAEPDKEQFVDGASGLPCLIVRNSFGALCGYVGVDSSHTLHGQHYDFVDADVHGGLTFSGACRHDPDEHGICHVPAPGEPDDVWWFGFDCAHYGDLCPQISLVMPGEYRDWAYVKSECAKLAAQLAAAAVAAQREA